MESHILHIASGDFFSTYGGGQVYVKNLVDGYITGEWRAESGVERPLSSIKITVVSFVEGVDEPRKRNYGSADLWEVPNNISESDFTKIISDISPDIIHAHSHKGMVCRIGKNLNIPVMVTAHHGGILCPGGALLNSKDQICHSQVCHKNCLPCVLRNIRTGLQLWYPFMRFLSESSYIKLGKFMAGKPFIPFITPVSGAALQIKRKKEEWQSICANASLLITPCDALAENAIRNGMSPEKVKVIPHGIPLPSERVAFPDLANGVLKFYYVGRICHVKGIHVLLEAFMSISNPKIELHLVGGAGNKTEQRYMDRLVAKSKSDTCIHWHGKVNPDQVFETTKSFHVSVAPSICMEAFGLNVAESLALGHPVLATRCGGPEMQVRDGENGWLVAPNDVEALAKKIQEIYSERHLLPKMSKNCHAISIATHIRALNDLVGSVEA